MAEHRSFVIVGAGLAGTRAATTLRTAGFDGDITLVGDEPHPPYDRVTLSKHFLYNRPGFHGLYLHDDAWYADNGIDLVTGAPAELIDTGRRDVKLTSGRRLRYDALLLATGSAPRRWHGRGADLAGVHYLRTLDDANALKTDLATAAATGGSVVVVGGGWAGLEVAAAAWEWGLPVDVIVRGAVPLQRQLGPELGAFFAAAHRSRGVDIHTGAAVTALGGSGRVENVVLADGSLLAADLVVFAIGASPRTELAAAAGIELAAPEQGGGIRTDECFRTSAPGVFAAGDVANVPNAAVGHAARAEHYSAAFHQGPAAARAMLGDGRPYTQLPFFFSDQFDIWMEYTGEHRPGDELVVRRLPAAETFLAFWLRQGRLTAGMNVNVKGVPETVRALVTAGRTLPAAALADPAVPLESLLV